MKESGGLWVRRYPGEPPPLVALHGFTQTGAMYAELAGMLGRETLALDLPGHGRSVGFPISFGSAVAGVVEVLVSLREPAPLVGYSQGGRVALAAALERPELVSHLVLISTTPGIEDEGEQAKRRRADEARAAELRKEGLAVFVDRWLSSSMFRGLDRRGAAWQTADRAVRLENTADGLAEALVGMGQGAQPYLGERLGDLRMPALVIAGERDEKYLSIASEMSRSLARGMLRLVPESGHAVIGEQPRIVTDLVAGLLAGPG
jgi:2-succinyl-6-hydroxy-2,4-cyclohexadiene-1-carboxylate synthase